MQIYEKVPASSSFFIVTAVTDYGQFLLYLRLRSSDLKNEPDPSEQGTDVAVITFASGAFGERNKNVRNKLHALSGQQCAGKFTCVIVTLWSATRR